MRVREHRGYGHGLRPGEDWDMNCLSCKREKAEGMVPVITGTDDGGPGNAEEVAGDGMALHWH